MSKQTVRYYLIYPIFKAIALLPLPALYAVGRPISFVLHRVVKYRLGVVRKNLSNVFPDKPVSELRLIEKDFYQNLVNVFLESIKLLHIKDSEIKRRVSVEGVDLVNEALESGKSVALMLGHFGNWEWVTASAMYMNKDAHIGEIYRPLSDKAFDRLMLKIRGRFGTENIPMSDSVRRLLAINKEGGKFVCGFISDQRPFTKKLKYWTDFCGIDTAYVNGAEAIGCKIGAEFLYTEMLREKRGYYKIKFSRLEPLDDGNENPYTRAFLKKLEENIKSNPASWLWSHNRWKRKRNP